MIQTDHDRYEKMSYRRVGHSGLRLSALSLGMWHNFGGVDPLENARAIIHRAFDLGITHFDLANNYGPPAGSAEENFGKILKQDLAGYRDELIISTKAGYHMWEGPYGEWGSRKHIISSLDQSLKRLGLDYVDIFYSHRPDPDTPFEETALALDAVVKAGKALYVGLSNYSPEQTATMMHFFNELKTPCIIHQDPYNLYNRKIENGLLPVLREEKMGLIAFSPLAQGQLTDRYLNGIPQDSRAVKSGRFLDVEQVGKTIEKSRKLNAVALERHQTLAEMSLAWLLKDPLVASVIIGASKVSQVEDNVKALENSDFSNSELEKIENILKKE